MVSSLGALGAVDEMMRAMLQWRHVTTFVKTLGKLRLVGEAGIEYMIWTGAHHLSKDVLGG